MLTRVLIADDEQLARDGLSSIVAGMVGFQVVAMAKDGVEAVKLAHESDPDICILDVKMPLLTGLEALDAIKRHRPTVRCIFYSGHDDFSYAQTAIKLKADEYLLKPATGNSLEGALRRVAHEAQAQVLSGTNPVFLQSGFDYGRHALEETFYRRLVSGECTIHDMSVEREMLGLRPHRVRVLIIGIDELRQIRLTEGEHKIRLLKSIFRSSVQRAGQEVLGVRPPVVFMDGSAVIVVEDAPLVMEFAKRLRHLAEVDSKTDISVAVGDAAELQRAADSYRTAQIRLGYRLVLSGRRVLSERDDEKVDLREADLPAELPATIAKSVRYIDRVSVDRQVGDLMNFFRHNVANPKSRQRLCFEIYEYCHFLVRDSLPDIDEQISLIDLSLTLRDVGVAGDLKRWLLTALHALMDVLQTRSHSYSLAIKKALDYIDRNYQRELSLSELASYVQLNPSYLSSLLRRESGKTFVEHWTDRRMDRAKELLASGDMNISEVAYEVGYENPRYFSMVFKKHVGLTPSEFRRSATRVGTRP